MQQKDSQSQASIRAQVAMAQRETRGGVQSQLEVRQASQEKDSFISAPTRMDDRASVLQEEKQSQQQQQILMSPQSKAHSSAISSKRALYQKQDAEEIIQDELKRKREESMTRVSSAKKVLASKTHQVIIDEIKQKGLAGGLNPASDQHKNLEDVYRQSLLGYQLQELSSYDGRSLHSCHEDLQNEDIVEETISKLSEKPHPLPQNPIDILGKEDNNATPQSLRVRPQGADLLRQEYLEKMKSGQKEEPRHFKSPSTSSSKKARQNQNHQIPFQKTSTFTSPISRVYYKNNFSKESKFVEKAQKQQIKQNVKENLQSELEDLVQSYEQQTTSDPERVEDMILEIHRLTQKSNGTVPQQQHAKLQSYVSNMEMHRATFSNRTHGSKSPVSRELTSTPLKSQKFQQQVPVKPIMNININAATLKDIIMHSESKVKQSLQQKNMSGLSTGRESMDKNFRPQTNRSSVNQSANLLSPQGRTEQRDGNDYQQQQDIQFTVNTALAELNARALARFYKRKSTVLRQGDYDAGYLLTLLAALLDESIPLSNDKSDIAQKSWEDLVRQMSNHGKIIYSLQKLRFMFEKPEFLRAVAKISFLKRYEDSIKEINIKAMVQEAVYPLLCFLEKISEVLYSLKAVTTELRTEGAKHKKKNSMSMLSHRKPLYQNQQLEYMTQSQLQSSPQSPTAHQPVNLRVAGRFSNMSSPKQVLNSSVAAKSPTVQGQILQQKQLAIEKTYMLQLEQSRSIRAKEMKAYGKQIEVAKMKIETKALEARMNREDKLKIEEDQKKAELDYLKYQSEYKHRLTSADQKQRDEDKRRIREKSLENQEYKRQVRQQQKENEIQTYREESMKSLHDLQWKTKQLMQEREKKNAEIKAKQQELLLSKVRSSEHFLTHKEGELDERLKNQFEQASTRFKLLQKQEESLKKEMSVLVTLQENRKQSSAVGKGK